MNTTQDWSSQAASAGPRRRKQPRPAIGAIRYEGSEYLWINDYDARMVMHPIKPELNGRDLADFKDPNGKRMFSAFADVVKEAGSGFIEYSWLKPGSDQPVRKVAAASEQASSNVQTVAAAAEELAVTTREIARKVGESSEAAEGASQQAQQARRSVAGLAEAAKRIGEIVTLINNIAEQTNLLALNATIEARAGEAGKGFAVVANEVKNLANHTAKASREIDGQITSVRTEIDGTVAAIQAIATTIDKVSEIATAVASAVEEQAAATQEIARNIEHASAGTQDVSSNITGVNEAACETGAAASQVLEAADSLARQAEEMRSLVSKFLCEVRAA